jgi:hypothetical protein
MTTIVIDKNVSWNKDEKVFSISERHIPFATSYKLLNPKTNKGVVFEFSHSTGPEFDINTKWIYTCDVEEVTLQVCNDAIMTNIFADNYLRAKLRK